MSDYPNEVPDESEQLDQIQPEDSLIDRGVDDVLDEGYSPPERYSPLIREGEHETLDERLAGRRFRARSVRAGRMRRSSTTERWARNGPVGWSSLTRASGRTWSPTSSVAMWASTAPPQAQRRLPCTSSPTTSELRSTCGRAVMPEHSGTDPLYPPIEPYAKRNAGGWRRPADPLGGVWKSVWASPPCSCTAGPAEASSPRCAGLFDPARYRVVLLRSARLWPEPPARQRTWSRSQCQHHLASRRRHRTAPRSTAASSSGRSSAALGAARFALAYAEQHPDRVTGAGAAGHLHAPAERARFLLQRRGRAAVSRALRDVPGSAGRSFLCRRRDRRVPRSVVRSRSGSAWTGRAWRGAPGRRPPSPWSRMTA